MSKTRNFFVRLYDILWREPRMIGRYYVLGEARSKRQEARGNALGQGAGDYPPNQVQSSKIKVQSCLYVFMADGRTGHGGMFDRLKGLISVYAVAKAQGKPFRIHFTYPFDLQTYLMPRDYDWRLREGELIFRFPKSRPLFIYGECYNPVRLMKDRRRQTHFYYGYNSLDKINGRYSTAYDWGQLYHELFQPTPYLQQYLDHYRQEVGTDYIVVHTRFLNLLGDKTETAINPELPEEERVPYMERIVEEMVSLEARRKRQEARRRVMLASDSMTFIEFAKQKLPDVYVVPGTVKHIDTAGKTDDGENIKMFLDYYLIAGAKKVYNIVGPGMWPSAFPEYAAKIGQTEFERVTIP